MGFSIVMGVPQELDGLRMEHPVQIRMMTGGIPYFRKPPNGG